MRPSVRAGIDVGDLQSYGHITGSDHPADRATDLRGDRRVADRSQLLSGFDDLSESDIPRDVSVGLCVEDAFHRCAAELARNTGVGECRSVPDHAAKAVSAHRLDHCIAVHSRDEARTEPDNEGGLADTGVERLLGKTGVNEHQIPARELSARLGDQHRHDAPTRRHHCLLGRIDPHPLDTVDLDTAV